MSTAHGQPGLSSEQRSTIRSTILSSRRTLEDELRRQLEKYGIFEDKKLPLDNLTHLSADEIHTRKKLDAAIERELKSTEGDLERSITNYVREATKTYLNRFVALKTIEVRGLVEETITERAEYGNRSYMHHTVAEVAGELTDAPDDGFGAALDLAYVAAGRLDGFWEYYLNPWDTAAGYLLVREAGGEVSDVHGDAFGAHEPSLLATNGSLHDEIIERLEGL